MFEFSMNMGPWEEWFSIMKKRSSETTKYLQAATNIFAFKDIIDHFKNESSPQGRWKPWSKSYREHMEKIGKGGNTILKDTGHLRDSIMPGTGKAEIAGNLRVKIKASSVSMGARSEYAAAHDFGVPSRNLPKREFMWLSDKAKELMLDMIMDKLTGEK